MVFAKPCGVRGLGRRTAPGDAGSAHNSLLLHLFDTMNAARDLPVWGSLKRRNSTPQRRATYHAEHGAIVAALHDRDPDTASAAMAEHLRRVTAGLLGAEWSGPGPGADG